MPRRRVRLPRPSSTSIADGLPSRIHLVAILGGFLGSVPIARGHQFGEQYEERLIDWALKFYGREIEPNPDGKPIEEILVASEEIIAPSDPWPGILNIVHVKTKESVIRRELLFSTGESYRRDLVEETERNLRDLFILAVARIVPIRAHQSGAVSLMVVTKDLWSIRTNSDFNVVGSLVQLIWLRPTEHNLLGLDKKIGLEFQLKLDTLAFGQSYEDRRVFGSRVYFYERSAVVLNRRDGRAEGSRGAVEIGRPLYSLDATWAAVLWATWNVRTARIYRGASVWSLPYPDAENATASIPYIYRARELQVEATYTRSYGREYKANIGAGVGTYGFLYRVPGSSGLDEQQTAWFLANYTPRSESATYLTAKALFYEAKFQVLRDINVFALSEDYQIGHRLGLTLRWANGAFSSPNDFFEATFSGRYRWFFKDDLFTLGAGLSIRYSPQIAAQLSSTPWLNRQFALQIENAFPPLWIGRFVVRGLWDGRAADLGHHFILLGGGNGLRGVPAEQLVGTKELLFNAEYRTRPLELWTLHLGFIFFWDAGTAYYGSPSLIHTIGLGLRALFPQFNVENLRIDLGYALNGPPIAFADRISASFGQITSYRPPILDRSDLPPQ